jgi:hypothetical protein
VPQNAPAVRPVLQLRREVPTELDQIGVLIVEEQLGLATTSLANLRSMAAKLPFEPCISFVSKLAGRVEGTFNHPDRQLALAEEFFGPSELVERYRRVMAQDPGAYIFGIQPLYTLMRILVEDAYDAPITQELTAEERLLLLGSAVAANSVIERDTDAGVGAAPEDLLAYELQGGSYHARPPWMEEMARHRELYRLATEDPDLAQSADFEPVKEWIERSGLTAQEQWLLGFGLSTVSHAFDPTKHPHVPPGSVEELLQRAGLQDRREQALATIAASRAQLQSGFAQLQAQGKRFMWELRPFNTFPFLRLDDDAGLLLLGRPWAVNWLGQGFHYRAMSVAQSEDATRAGGRADHVQRYTAFSGQVFEQYCLHLARDAITAPGIVLGEQPYGKGGGQKTSDVAIVLGDDLILFEANARRVGAEPLVGGDPLDVSGELAKLLVKKINQLGVVIGALLSDEASLPGIDLSKIKRIFPVVVSLGHVWQTHSLWGHLDAVRDPEKCKPLSAPRVQPLQAFDAGDYEKLLALAHNGSNIAELLGWKTSGPYRCRDFAVWLHEDERAPDHTARLPGVKETFAAMAAELTAVVSEPE